VLLSAGQPTECSTEPGLCLAGSTRHTLGLGSGLGIGLALGLGLGLGLGGRACAWPGRRATP